VGYAPCALRVPAPWTLVCAWEFRSHPAESFGASLALIKKGLTREAAYNLCQDAAMKTWEVSHAGRNDAPPSCLI